MDYKELIEQLRSVTLRKNNCYGCGYCEQAATTIEPLLAEREAQREVAEDIADDFIDFVTGGVQNAAPYCANMRPECCERPNWCTGQSKECKGFFPKAAKGPTPPDRQKAES